MSRRVVLDGSAATEAVVPRRNAGQVLDLVEGALQVSAPDLYAAEVANAIWKHTKGGDLDAEDAQTALESCLELIDVFEPTLDLAPEALATAVAHDHPVYDALYAVAARRGGATMCTLDGRLAQLLDAMAIPYVLPG